MSKSCYIQIDMHETPREGLRHKRTLPDGSPAPLRPTVRCGWHGDDVGLSTESAKTAREIFDKLKAQEDAGTPLTDKQEQLRALIKERFSYMLDG